MVFHKEHRVPYIYKGYEWIGYDDPFSLHLKVCTRHSFYDVPYCVNTFERLFSVSWNNLFFVMIYKFVGSEDDLVI